MSPPTRAIDTHAHLYFDGFDDDRPAVIDRAREAGFGRIVNAGIDVATSRASIELARAYPGLCYASAGLHPNGSALSEAELARALEEIETLLDAHPREIVAIGEIGLDFHRDHATPAEQQTAFCRQLEIAERRRLPVIIHCRKAWRETLEVVAGFEGRLQGVFHCFEGTAEEARRAVALGWHLSFTGMVTYPQRGDLRETARGVPEERLLLETDAPFLAPQPVRGRRNEPAFALYTAALLAEQHGVTRDEMLRVTTENAERLFSFEEER
ncbi:MAG: TatD family hydrolase [Planctomycetota bacterium]